MVTEGAFIPFGTRFEGALLYATRAHALQRRKGTGVPYIAHFLAVAAIVGEGGGDEDKTIAALLHDAGRGSRGARRGWSTSARASATRSPRSWRAAPPKSFPSGGRRKKRTWRGSRSPRPPSCASRPPIKRTTCAILADLRRRQGEGILVLPGARRISAEGRWPAGRCAGTRRRDARGVSWGGVSGARRVDTHGAKNARASLARALAGTP